MTALGKLAPEFRDMVRDGKSFDEIMAAMSVTMGGAATEAANTAEGRFKRLGVAMGETKESIGSALLPVIEAILPVVEKFAKWAQDNPTAFMIIAGAIGAIALSIMAINFAMALNPFTAIAMGVIALIALIIGAYKRFESFRNIVDAVFGAIKWWVTNVTIPIVESLLGVFKTVFNGIGKIWNSTVGKIKFTIPDWVPGVGGKGFDMPDIPMLAKGGIVTSPTLALIGEGRGPEAVIPLNRMSEFTGGGGNNVNIHVNGADPQAVVDALRTYMFRNGSVPIRIAG